MGLHSELDAAYAPELTEYEGISGEKTAVAALEELMSAAKEAGVPLYVTRGYVSRSEQDALFEERVRTLMEEGYTRVRAEATAQETVAPGGMDEHQTGLAFDFWQEGLDADGDFTNSQAYNWLVKNCVEYGFVLRYAANKEDETYMPYDPTHFRFVGRENARAMRTLDMCLEEYAAYVGKQDGR